MDTPLHVTPRNTWLQAGPVIGFSLFFLGGACSFAWHLSGTLTRMEGNQDAFDESLFELKADIKAEFAEISRRLSALEAK